jgi:aspartate ammonia-lyase
MGCNPKVAQIAKIAYESSRTVREIAREVSELNGAALERLLNPRNQTDPRKSNKSDANS